MSEVASKIMQQIQSSSTHKAEALTFGILFFLLLGIVVGYAIVHWFLRRRTDQRTDEIPLTPQTPYLRLDSEV